jgi:hypothetical protein
MTTMESAIEQCESVLNQLRQSDPERFATSPALRDFKLILDDLRLTLWAVIQSQEEARRDVTGKPLGLADKLVEFRVKRLIQMLAALQQDVDNGRVSRADLSIRGLSKALRGTLDGLSRLGM